MVSSHHPLIALIVVMCVVLGAARGAEDIVPAANLAPSPYHRWAHEHWVWNHNSMSDQQDLEQLMDDYAAHDIKFGGVNIDSTWATQYNNFEVDTEKFSDFAGLVSSIHKAGRGSFVGHLVCEWITPISKRPRTKNTLCVISSAKRVL